jgi:hypothetical protein
VGKLLRFLNLDVQRDHVRAIPSEALDDGAADAVSGAGHQNDALARGC